MFWVRHALLVVLCIILPFGAALYLDTGAELSRAREVGERAARLAKEALSTQLRLRAHESLEEVTQIARQVARVPGLGRDGVQSILQDAMGERGGFAWYVDASGRIVIPVGESGSTPRSIQGRPSFVVTQRGISLDTIWIDEGQVRFVAASPVPVGGRAQGAVFIARPIDAAWLSGLSMGTGADVSLRIDEQLAATTLDEETRRQLEAAEATSSSVRHFGRPELAEGPLPFLPLFFDHEVTAYTTADLIWQGDRRVHLDVAVHSGERLDGLAPRQLTVLGAMAASLMLAILVGLINSRTFVHPLGVIEAHLSELQMGRGGAELPETRVSRPFRRVVRLINMTVQKIPARGYGTASSSVDLRGPDVTGSLGAAPLNVSSGPSSRGATPGAQRPPSAPEASGPLEPAAFSSGPAPAGFGFGPPEPGQGPMATLGSDDLQAAPPSARRPATIPEDLPAEEPSRSGPVFDDPESTESAVAAALDAMGEASSPSRRRSAQDIRGGAPMALSTADLSLNDGVPDLGQPSGMPRADREDRLRDATLVAPSSHHSTVVASVPEDLLAQALDAQLGGEPDTEQDEEDEERLHHREVFQRFVDLRRQCGEPTADLAFDKFERKLQKNRDQLVEKYGCRTVRFQVYEKGGKAALKASPVRT